MIAARIDLPEASLKNRLTPLDWALVAYNVWAMAVVVVLAGDIEPWSVLAAGHLALIGLVFALRPRGAPWERARPADGGWTEAVRQAARFLRYTYPALLLTPFFEEARFTVEALQAAHGYWFERHLYAADRAIFGATPAVAISSAGGWVLDELMHALYFSYYLLIAGGIVVAWKGRASGARPAAGFDAAMTAMMVAFLTTYALHPLLPARGPWENEALVSGLREFRGVAFVPLVEWIIDRAAVSGACFPSAHVSGTWGLVVGLSAFDRRAARWIGLAAIGLTVACVYTRYHHVADVVAGVVVGLGGGAIGRMLVTRRAS